MTNREKYEKELKEAIETRSMCEFVKKNVLKGTACTGVRCNCCALMFMTWIGEEYKEPEVDWSKVPIDTKVIVPDCRGENCRRHFAGVDSCGNKTFFANGKTSFTAVGSDVLIVDGGTFKSIKLYEGQGNAEK